ncbi:FAS1 domain-containing protein fsc1 [Elsinoe australis]|uniref:FAS1 domain-containing protein fsc1 n=1 Tax=Elsinoe australis TaxID=40998 RepID=A0A2P8ABG9_9PEZI|nr:FAS1 domain-containing protein fsc1 [Elsinoe australis]
MAPLVHTLRSAYLDSSHRYKYLLYYGHNSSPSQHSRNYVLYPQLLPVNLIMLLKTLLQTLVVSGLAAGVSIVEVLQSDPELSTTLDVLNRLPDIVRTVTNAPGLTVFAPTNAAWDRIFGPLNQGIPDLENRTNLLGEILRYHVLPSRLPTSAIDDRGVFRPTLLTNNFLTTVRPGQVIKALRVPTTPVSFNITSGAGSQSIITKADIPFDKGGVAHVLNRVLTIPALVNNTAVVSEPPFTNFTDALDQAGILDPFNEFTQSATVFAPSNPAFAAFGPLPSGDLLRRLLEYHIVDSRIIRSTDLRVGQLIPTKNGQTVRVTSVGREISFNNVKAGPLTIDVPIKNGVLYEIDQVLTPPGF